MSIPSTLMTFTFFGANPFASVLVFLSFNTENSARINLLDVVLLILNAFASGVKAVVETRHNEMIA